MARMTCKCGKLLDNHEAPNDIELIVYTDKEWDAICNCDSIQPWMMKTVSRKCLTGKKTGGGENRRKMYLTCCGILW